VIIPILLAASVQPPVIFYSKLEVGQGHRDEGCHDDKDDEDDEQDRVDRVDLRGWMDKDDVMSREGRV
jgi:hypothetical protein